MNRGKRAYDDALRNLTRALKTLEDGQGRIARRNARRRTLGAMRRLRNVIEAQYPAISKPRDVGDPIADAAKRMRWREFEYKVIKHVRRDWDAGFAQSFTDHVCAYWGAGQTSITIAPLSIRMMGDYSHSKGVIRLREDLIGDNWWRTLIHELAHAVERTKKFRDMWWGSRKRRPTFRSHGKMFVASMAEVYKMWVAYLEKQRVAAKRDTQNTKDRQS